MSSNSSQFNYTNETIVGGSVVDVQERLFCEYDLFSVSGDHHDRIKAFMEEFPEIISADYYLLPLSSDDKASPNVYFAFMAYIISYHVGDVKIINKRWGCDYSSFPLKGVEVINVTRYMAEIKDVRITEDLFDSNGDDFVLYLTDNSRPSSAQNDFIFESLLSPDFKNYSKTLGSYSFLWKKSYWSWMTAVVKIIVGSHPADSPMSKLNLVLQAKNHYGIIAAVIIYGLGIQKFTNLLCEYRGDFTVMPAVGDNFTE